MTSYVLVRRARVDIQQIWNHIAEDDMNAADKVRTELQLAMRKLASMPGMGHRRADVSNTRYRFWTVHPYVIAYVPDTSPIQIIRVVHGHRDFRTLLDG